MAGNKRGRLVYVQTIKKGEVSSDANSKIVKTVVHYIPFNLKREKRRLRKSMLKGK